MEPKRLYRSSKNRVIGGVSGGLAEYFFIDPLIIRLIFVALALLGGGGVIIYLILWIALPEERSVKSNPDFFASSFNPEPSPKEPEPEMDKQEQNPHKRSEEEESKTKGAIIAGVILITLGSLFFIDNLIPDINFGHLWPILLIVIGLVLIVTGMPGRSNKRNF